MQTHFWIMAGSAPAGPFTVDEIHRKLETNEITWQTAACPVGDSTWRPLAKTPNLGPSLETASIQINDGARELTALPNLLRTLIVVEVGVVLLAVALAIVGGAMEIGPAQDPATPIGIVICYLVIFIPMTIAAWIGLWLIHNWGRWLYLGSVCFGHFLGLVDSFTDVSAHWHFPTAIFDIAQTTGGVLIGIAFFSPLAAAFRRSGLARRA